MSKIIAQEYHDMRMKHWRTLNSKWNKDQTLLIQQYRTEEFGDITVQTQFTSYGEVGIQTIFDGEGVEENECI